MSLRLRRKQSLDVLTHNWTRCLNILKVYRVEGDKFDRKELSQEYRVLESSFTPSQIIESAIWWGLK